MSSLSAQRWRPHSGRAALVAALAVGCAENLTVPVQPQPAFATAQRVDSAPPPAQIEYLSSEAPRRGCRWVDGQWIWNARRWDWRPGGWVQPPAGCRYSLPSTTWVGAEGSGALYYRPGRWYSVSEPKICPDPAPCPGADGRSRDLPRSP